MIRTLALAVAGLTLTACASTTDYLHGGSVERTHTVVSGHRATIMMEEVVFSDVLPGMATDERFRYVVRNHGQEPVCARVRLEIFRGGGYRHGGIFLVPPDGQRVIIAYVQNAYGEGLDVSESAHLWLPQGTDCHTVAPP